MEVCNIFSSPEHKAQWLKGSTWKLEVAGLIPWLVYLTIINVFQMRL